MTTYRGVKLYRVEYLAAIDIGKREDSPVKPIMGKGWSLRPGSGSYPFELKEIQESVDRLTNQAMLACGVTEKEAIILLNDVGSI